MNCVEDQKLRDFVERRLDEREMADVARHIACCEDCQNYENFYANCLVVPEDEPTEAERALIADIAGEVMALLQEKASRGMWNSIVESFRSREVTTLAAADGQSGNQRQAVAAADAGFFHFYSHGLKDDPDPRGWRALLAKPPSGGTSDRYLLQFHVEGVDGKPVSSGTLTFFGQCYEVRNGLALVPKSRFLSGTGEGMISLCRHGGEEIPGAPIL